MIDYWKVDEDTRLEALRATLPTSSLPDDRIVEEYGYLAMIE